MAKKRGRGGYRKPTPTRKNAVSGPGALSQRTDGNQPVMRLPDAKYGESKAFEEQQQAAPLGDSGGANMPLPLEGTSNPSNVLWGPSELPNQELTSGAPIGPGLSTESGFSYQEDDLDILLNVLAERNKDNLIIRQMINSRESQRPQS
mgnify:CR=1 FL=1